MCWDGGGTIIIIITLDANECCRLLGAIDVENSAQSMRINVDI